MNPSRPLHSPLDLVVVETLTGCLVNVPKSVPPPAALPFFAAEEPSPAPASDAAPVSGVRSSALLARRRRTQDDPTLQPSPRAMDMIGRFRMIINIVESTSPPEVEELLKAIRRLDLATGASGHREQKRRRWPAGSASAEAPGAAACNGGLSASVLQETIAAIEQMRLSEPMERSEEYAEVLGKLKELLRAEEDG